MAKNVKGKTAEVTIGGEKRTLKYPMMALIKLEKETGLKLEDMGDEEISKDMGNILSFIWAGLIHEDRELSLDELGFELEVSEMQDVVEGMTKVLEGNNEGEVKN